jgi:hypothetical protein
MDHVVAMDVPGHFPLAVVDEQPFSADTGRIEQIAEQRVRAFGMLRPVLLTGRQFAVRRRPSR